MGKHHHSDRLKESSTSQATPTPVATAVSASPTVARAVLPADAVVVIPYGGSQAQNSGWFSGGAGGSSSSVVPVSAFATPLPSRGAGAGAGGDTVTAFAVGTAVMDVEQGGTEGGVPLEFTERQQALLFVYRLARTVRYVSVLQLLFICAFAAFSPVFVVLLPCALAGYLGARWYQYWLLFGYCCYLLLETLGGVVSLVLLHSQAFIALRILYMLLLLAVARVAVRLAAYCGVLDAEDRAFLYTHPLAPGGAGERSLWC